MPKLTAVPLALLLLVAPSEAQEYADAYLDPTARELVESARAARGRQGSEIESYTALVSSRHAARLRLPLRDRLLARSESVERVRWTRGGGTIVQQLGARSEELGDEGPTVDVGVDPSNFFDPEADRIYFGIDVGFMDSEDDGAVETDSAASDSSSVAITLGEGGIDVEADVAEKELDEFWIAHPLAEGSERYYQYRSGDTLTLRLPGGRTVRSVELNAIPRRASFHHLRASLWLEPETGSLVRAIYRPSRDLDLLRDSVFDPETVEDMDMIPGMLRPLVFDLELMSVEYSLWNQKHWLPHRMRMEGHARAGVVRLVVEGELAYRIEQVDDEPMPSRPTAAEVLAEWGVDTAAMRMDTIVDGDLRSLVVRPVDDAELLGSELLPPPIWEDAPEFASASELEAFARRLDVMIPGMQYAAPPRFELQFLHGGRGLVRYNRIEAISLGVRGVVDHAYGRAYATVRLGAADLHPNAEIAALVPRPRHAWRIEGYHRLATTEPIMPAFEAAEPALGFGNSVNALAFGQDEGFYFRETGLTLALEPRPEDRQSWRIGAYYERHDDADRKVEWNVASWLDSDARFEPNIDVAGDAFVGTTLLWRPWFGLGTGPQAGLEVFGEAANGALADLDSTFARARLTARTVLPLFSGMRLGAEAAAGTAWGGLPLEYAWFLGGAETLRGYEAGAAVGESMARARLELARGNTAFGLTLFSDAAWAGRRADFDRDDALLSAGVGFTLMDGLLRIDVARALASPTGWRAHFYLDALL